MAGSRRLIAALSVDPFWVEPVYRVETRQPLVCVMAVSRRILLTMFFSVAATLAGLALLSRISGIGVPAVYWCFAGLCPAVLSGLISARLVWQAERVRQLHAELREANARLKIVAETDCLTGLLNRRAFFERVAAQRTTGRPGWFVLLDIDHFKTINDRFGHDRGDEAIRTVARAITEMARPQDVVGRIGGEEFAIYLPSGSHDDVLLVADLMRRRIAQTGALRMGEEVHMVTVSLGICADRAETLEENLRQADLAMYQAKHGGRNRVAMAA